MIQDKWIPRWVAVAATLAMLLLPAVGYQLVALTTTLLPFSFTFPVTTILILVSYALYIYIITHTE